MKRTFLIALVALMLISIFAVAVGCSPAAGESTSNEEYNTATPSIENSDITNISSRDFGTITALDVGNGTEVVVFGSDEQGFYATASLLVKNGNAFLIDTKLTKTGAQEIVNYIESSGVNLRGIFISHSDPEYYFGLSEIKNSYPDVVSQTTSNIAKDIVNTGQSNLILWDGALGSEKPDSLVVPQVLEEDSFEFEGLTIEIFGTDPSRTALYIPELEMVLGGPNVVSGNHLFLAEMDTPEKRQRWIDSLIEIDNLNSTTVIPGHTWLEDEAFNEDAIEFSIGYLETVNEILSDGMTDEEFIRIMEQRYPGLVSHEALVQSANALTETTVQA